jgi:hypothetical protein
VVLRLPARQRFTENEYDEGVCVRRLPRGVICDFERLFPWLGSEWRAIATVGVLFNGAMGLRICCRVDSADGNKRGLWKATDWLGWLAGHRRLRSHVARRTAELARNIQRVAGAGGGTRCRFSRLS